MDVAYAGDDEMTITVHAATGSTFTIVSHSGDNEPRYAEDVPENEPIDFDPLDLESLLAYLARILGTAGPFGAISVRVPDPETGAELVWVWSLTTFTPLRRHDAEEQLPGVDVPISFSAYGCITDRCAPLPLTPVTDRVVMTLAPSHH